MIEKSEKIIDYNKLASNFDSSLQVLINPEFKYRCLGKTTGEILQLIGTCNAEPNRKQYVKDFISDFNKRGSQYNYWVSGEICMILNKLDFIGYELDRRDYSLIFKPFGKCKITVEVLS